MRYLESKNSLASLELAPRDGTSSTLTEATELYNSILHAHNPPALVIQVLCIKCPGLLQAHLIKGRFQAVHAALALHAGTALAGVGIKRAHSTHGIGSAMWFCTAQAVLRGEGERGVLRASRGWVAAPAVQRPEAARPAVCSAALAAATGAMAWLRAARGLVFLRSHRRAHRCGKVKLGQGRPGRLADTASTSAYRLDIRRGRYSESQARSAGATASCTWYGGPKERRWGVHHGYGIW